MASNVNNRPNRVAKGFTKHYERREAQNKQRITNPNHPLYKEKEKLINRLIVRGTTDDLHGYSLLYRKLIKIEHPIDRGFFKQVYILSDMGKGRLKRLKREKERERAEAELAKHLNTSIIF